jgi:hypothetical protein
MVFILLNLFVYQDKGNPLSNLLFLIEMYHTENYD